MAALSPRTQTSRQPAWILGFLGLLCIAMMLLHIAVGSEAIPLDRILRALLHPAENDLTIWQIRLPRTATCLATGAILGLVGSTFQAIFRNPLADPYIVGVSSGAAVGGAWAMAYGFGAGFSGPWVGLGPVILATLGGVLTLAVVLTLSMRRGKLEIQALLLTGVITGSLLSSLLSLIMQYSGQDRQILSWLLGHITPAYWNRFWPLLIMLAVTAPILFLNARKLNALAMGDDTARTLGVNVDRVRALLLVTGAIMVSFAVANVGIIGFLGLVSPHIARRMLGVDWRWSLIGSGLVGAALLCAADIEAQRIVHGQEVPVGIVTAIIGAPLLIFLMRRTR